MTIEVSAFAESDAPTWDEFCSASINGTFLHSRRFLSYHGERFADCSLLVRDSGRLAGILPAAQSPTQADTIISHPGITYGGVVHGGRLVGMKMLETLQAVADHYGRSGYRRLLYKCVPCIHARAPAQDDAYALFRLGARRVRCDLSCAIDLAGRLARSERRRRGLKRAAAAVTTSEDPALLAPLWDVLADNLARKHDARPVHSRAELSLLRQRFPREIRLLCALIDGRVEAGVVLFNSATAWHAQYIASSERGYAVSALDMVFECAIESAAAAGARYFDFGTSNEQEGTVLNDGLYRFKSEFGASGVAHEYYELDLAA